MNNAWKNQLSGLMPQSEISFDVPMKELCTMRVGGLADAFLSVSSSEEIINALKAAKQLGISSLIIGNGSNLIVRDGGIRGFVIQIGKNYSKCTFEGQKAVVDAGCGLPFFASGAVKNGLAGLEFAAGIPGTVGGAVTMNAGAYGGTISQCLKKVRVVDKDLQIREIIPQKHDMGYRKTIFGQQGMTVIEAEFEFDFDVDGSAKKNYDDFRKRRQEKQPLNFPSAGSVFKRPEGHFAGQLIEQAGLKGFRIGGAQVSEKHAGFIINLGDATAKNITDLIQEIISRVEKNSGITLETEVKIIGEEQ